ncbi:hypothetical protein MBAV_006103 [Candidatus Magnetobacterium bavaricum]|uniref:Uncharacterized protein n=1 Tax=Candidatus Magnetobacterium bavaricum TaxID=29290 RepID=A0A0F3GII4_9BACT|nr:hypothetical protein MBAV_006103 [Candidatus Magnetobacterium bavaricum]
MRAIQRKKGAAPPPFRTPCKGTSPLDPIKVPHILYLIQSKSAIYAGINLPWPTVLVISIHINL